MTIEDENQESENNDNKEPEPEPEPDIEDIDEEINNLLGEIERLTAENAALISRVGECESAIAALREHKHEPEPEPEPEPKLPEPEPIPTENHIWYRTIGGRKS